MPVQGLHEGLAGTRGLVGAEDIRRMKPKELAALQLQIAEKLQRPREVVGNAFAA